MTLGAFDAYVQDAQERALREEYANFRDDIKRDLSPIEAEFGGCPSFEEWLVDHRRDDFEPDFPEVQHYV